MASLPNTPGDITADWLNQNLSEQTRGGATVVAVSDSDIGEGTGIFGMISSLDLTWEGGDGSAPQSIVAKMACTEPANLEVALALGIYERELRFFETIAPQTPLRVPQCHLIERSDDGRFLLLLENMSENYAVGDQVEGATLAQAEAIVDALAPMHAQWWEAPALDDLDWLPSPDAPAYQAAVPGIYRAGLPVFVNDWADRVPAESIELAQALDPKFEEVLLATATGPRTFTHSDTRLDNIFFGADGSIAFIDFQLALRARATADIAYLVGTSMKTEEATASWESVLRRWHGNITELGVQYDWDACLRDYRENALYYLCGAMSLLGSFDTGNERGEAMAAAYTTRLAKHLVDIDAGSVL